MRSLPVHPFQSDEIEAAPTRDVCRGTHSGGGTKPIVKTFGTAFKAEGCRDFMLGNVGASGHTTPANLDLGSN